MARSCVNPLCSFDFVAMRGVCRDPRCIATLDGCTCGQYYELARSGDATAIAPPAHPEADNVAWLCCVCAAEFHLVSKRGDEVMLIAQPDPHDFVRRWEFVEACLAHEQ